MYYAVVALLMFLLPVASIGLDMNMHGTGFGLMLIGKWYVFWAVGVRLLLAGLRQTIQPRYTAQHILGIQGDDALLLVRELGCANLSIGTIGSLSLLFPGWTTSAALAGGIFYGLAGINHLLQKHRNRLENVAMWSDLFAGALLLVFYFRTLIG